MTFELKINRDMALGNGTRRKGEVLALVEGVEPEELCHEAFHLVGNDLSSLPGEIERADGVESIEILTALRNSHLCEFARPPRRAARPAVEDSATDGEPSAEELPPVKAAPKRSRAKPKAPKSDNPSPPAE